MRRRLLSLRALALAVLLCGGCREAGQSTLDLGIDVVDAAPRDAGGELTVDLALGDAPCSSCIAGAKSCCPEENAICECRSIGGCLRFLPVESCAAHESCVGEACCKTTLRCGQLCCSEGETCVNSSCCPQERACSSQCCSADAVCVDDQTCCPATRACGGSCCATGQLCISGACKQPASGDTLLFVTNTAVNGNLGGRAGADDLCFDQRPKELSCGEVRAFISVIVGNEISSMPTIFTFAASGELSFYNRQTRAVTILASSWSDALDGSITVSVAQGTGAVFSPISAFWTGSTVNGKLDVGFGFDHTCGGWTSSDGSGDLGAAGDANATTNWLTGGVGYACSEVLPLLCACKL